MNSDPKQDVALFAEALQLPLAERAAFLERACACDAELRARVEGLLRTHDNAGDFLERPPPDAPPVKDSEASLGEKPGDKIGRYKLLRQIGEGGCGVVYLAEQEEPVRRQVALKIIKPGMDSKSVMARFEAERQALALMDHPNISKVLDAGATESGRPYFVMELVRGIKITDYCDQNSFTTEQRLKLFVKVCRAIQHAHQKGIIHRDIKPSNILVTTTAEGALPVVIDFGIAKATTNQRLTDKTLFTAFEMLIGTPAYMSPEQAELSGVDIDTRTDIYSLGVLLYELLTGSTPFDDRSLMKAGLDEVRRIIREKEPERPSTRLSTMAEADLTMVAQRHGSPAPGLIRSVRGDLDWIVMKALEKARTRRYETANGLALDVERHLANEPISARPPSTMYKFQKTVARNKLLFGAVGAIATLLVVSLVLVTASLGRERQARREANSDKLKAQTEAARSVQTTRFLKNMLAGVGPSAAKGRDTVMLREILDRTANAIGTAMGNQPAVEAEMRSLIGRLYFDIGEFAQAEPMHRAAVAIRRTLHGDDAELAAALSDLGSVLLRIGKLDEAESVCKEALLIRQRLYDHENLEVAASLTDLSGVFNRQGRNSEGERLARDSLAIRRRLLNQESLGVAESLYWLAMNLANEGRNQESEIAAKEALRIRRKLLGNEDLMTTRTLLGLSIPLLYLGKLEEAEAACREALAIRRKVLGNAHFDTALALHYLGRCLRQKHNFAECETVLREALSIYEKKPGEASITYRDARRQLMLALQEQGKWSEIEAFCRELLGHRESPDLTDDAIVEVVQFLVNALTKQKKFPEADQLLTEILTPDFIEKQAGANVLELRANLHGSRGEWLQAADDTALALELQPTNHLHYHTLAPLLIITHNRESYEKLCHQILATFGNTTDAFVGDRMAKDCLLIASTNIDLKAVSKLADTAVTVGSNSSGLPWFQACKALSDYRQGEFTEAIEWAQKSLSGSFVFCKALAASVLAMAQWRLGHYEDARNALAMGNTFAPADALQRQDGYMIDEWINWLVARILLDEADALLNSPQQQSSR